MLIHQFIVNNVLTTILIHFFIISAHSQNNDYNLKQVLLLSRHNVRTPLSKDLSLMTPKSWPVWKEKSGYLTNKGALLEGYMGEYFSAWLRHNHLLPEGCPCKESLFVYANYKQRAMASAQAFVDKGFPGCNITVNSKRDIDPVFNPIIHNDTEVFIKLASEEMQEKLNGLNLSISYNELEDILDYRHSEICKLQPNCNLNTDKNIIYIKSGQKPNILGPLKTGNAATDAFIMQYFQGFTQEKIAWGKLVNQEQWQLLTNLQRHYHNIIFNSTHVAKDISRPLLQYITDIFLNDYDVPKVTLLMGHDANLLPLLNAMGFKPHYFVDQYEQTPVGGKLVFQKWQNVETAEYFLKINYVYQSSVQLRNAVQLSLTNPPQTATMVLQNCKVDKDGLCSWKDFEKLLHTL